MFKKLQKINLFENETKEFGYLMFYLEPENFIWEDLLKIIKIEDIFDEKGYGLEKEPHVTFLPSILNKEVDFDNLKKHMEDIDLNFQIICNKVSNFKNDKFDVLKFDVKRQDLNKSNEVFNYNDYFKKRIKTEDHYKHFNPHITLSYLKKNSSEKYLKEMTNNYIFNVKSVVYGSKNKKIIIDKL
jgi:2'-5' RNA ligase